MNRIAPLLLILATGLYGCESMKTSNTPPPWQGKTQMSAEELKAQFANKTFDGRNERKDKEFVIYTTADGKWEVHYQSGKVKVRGWRVKKDNTLCVIKKGRENCWPLYKMDDGSVIRVKHGERHTHTYKNFRDGKHI